MTEELYHQLASACDSILLHPKASLDWIAIPVLHVLSEHPVHLAVYQDIFVDEDSSGGNNQRFLSHRKLLMKAWEITNKIASKENGIAGAHALANWIRNLVKSGDEDPYGPSNLDKVDVIIVSWLVSVDHLNRIDDFYFGNIQSILADRGLSSLLVLRNQTGHPTSALAGRIEGSRSDNRIILPGIVSTSKELSFMRRYIKVRRQLRQAERKSASRLERQICRLAGSLRLSRTVLPNLRLHSQLAGLCRHLQPSIVLTLYEGHAWERCVWHAARSSSRSVFCVGYQHTILRKHSHALKRSLGPNSGCDPDLILTVGDVTRDTLEASQSLESMRILTLGTHRRTEVPEFADGPRQEITFLVLPEGNESECIYLFEFALECAKRLPGVQFIFRTHPVIAFDRVKSRLRGYHSNLNNVEVSANRSIEEDFAHAGFILYRGSSTVIYAILAGLKPFYVAKPREMNIDPLYELSEWRDHVQTVDDFTNKFQLHQVQPRDGKIREWQRAREFCDRYVQPIREDAIDEMITLGVKLPRRLMVS